MANVLKISSHDELISYVPHTLGFQPESSMVCLAFSGGPTSRLDLPDSPSAMGPFLHELSDVYLRRHPTPRVALVAFGEDGLACLQALSALGETLVSSDRGPDVGPMLWVNGEEWFDVLEGTSGTVDPGTRSRIDAEFALMGRVMPTGRREDLAAAMQGDLTGVAQYLPAAEARVVDMDLSSRAAEVKWLGSRLDEFLQNREYLFDGDAARVLAIIHDGGARDAAVFSLSQENAPVFSEFWQDLVRRAPTEVRDSPATMLALSSFLEGKGAKAWTALDQLTGNDPLADLLTVALEQAVDPREWDRAVPAATSTLMQQAALRDTAANERRTRDQNAPGVSGAGPAPSAPGR